MSNQSVVNIRKAEMQDLGLLLDYGHKLHQVELQYEPDLTYSESDGESHYAKQLKNPEGLFLIVELDSRPVGYLYAHIYELDYLRNSPRECEIEVIYLEPEARGKRLSQLLIDKCITWAKEKKVTRIKAGIYIGNKNSRAAFEKYGFNEYHSTFILKP